jgi:hypothetical protein
MGGSYVQPFFGFTRIGILWKMNCVGCNYNKMYRTRSNINVPFASAVMTIELEQLSSAYGSSTTTTTAGTEPKPRAIVSPTTYIATRVPIIQAALTQSAPTVPPTQRHSRNQHARRNNNQGCCNN